MFSKLFMVALALAVSTHAAPISARDDAQTTCNLQFENTASFIQFACSGLALSTAQLSALGQQSCINATSVAIANFNSCSPAALASSSSKRAVRKGKGKGKKAQTKASQAKAATPATATTLAPASDQKLAATANDTVAAAAGLAQAQACADAVAGSFTAVGSSCGISNVGGEVEGLLGKRGNDCTNAQAAAFQNITAGCSAATVSTSNAAGVLQDATNAGVDAGRLDSQAQKFANATAQAPSFAPPSSQNCVANSLQLAQTLTDGLGSTLANADANTLQQQQIATNSAAMLSIVEPGCGAAADLQKADAASFAAGVGQAKGQSCFDATVSASDSAAKACFTGGDGFSLTSGTLVESAACTAAQVTSVGLISAACPATAAA